MRDLLHQFGVIVEPGDNYLKHTLSMLLNDDKDKIAHRVDSTQWKPEEFLGRLPIPKSALAPGTRQPSMSQPLITHP